MNCIESNGKTVEEALAKGLATLGCTLDEVTYETLDKGSPGLFGMFGRLARVKITVNEVEDEFKIDLPEISIKPAEKKKAKPAQKVVAAKEEPVKEVKAPVAEAVVKSDVETAQNAFTEEDTAEAELQKPKKQRKPRRKKEQPAAEKQEAVQETVPPESVREFPPLDVDALSEDARKAYNFVSNLARLMSVDAEIRVLEEEDQIFIDITNDSLGVLIGRRGETLDAVQYLTSLNVNKDREEYKRVTIDVEHYRAKREETLRKLAVRMANRVRKSGRRVALEPMNPYERRVLHSALQNDPYVETHSEGEEPHRRVIITLK